MAYVLIVDDEVEGTRTVDVGAYASVGRAPFCTVRVGDDGVAQRHCEIVRTGEDRYLLRDGGAAGGTLIAGQPVTRQLLRDGDEIRIGSARLRFHLGSATDRRSTIPTLRSVVAVPRKGAPARPKARQLPPMAPPAEERATMLEGMVRRLATRVDLLVGERDELLTLLGESRERVVLLEDRIDRLEALRASDERRAAREEHAEGAEDREPIEPALSRLRAAG